MFIIAFWMDSSAQLDVGLRNCHVCHSGKHIPINLELSELLGGFILIWSSGSLEDGALA